MRLEFLQPRHWLAIILGVGSALLLTGLLLDGEVSARFKKPQEPPVIVSTGAVQSGQILASLLSKPHMDAIYIPKIQASLSEQLNLRRDIQPGHNYELTTSTTGVFKKFVYKPNLKERYIVTRSSMGVYSCTKGTSKTVWLEKTVSCEITKFLNHDLKEQGFSDRFVGNVVGALSDQIFAWRIDFFTEQRPGDKVDLLLEEEYLVGEDDPIPGRVRVLAAYYKGSGTKKKDNYAFRYQSPSDKKPEYFDEEGKAVRKVFLRAPFKLGNFRISSHFNRRRFHPIKRTYRPHHGTDYAAARGTPIAAIGKGKVILAGWKGNYGKTIEIRHTNRYKSRYGHLSKILVKPGQHVEQGQHIGNVGSTGLSTGPHLHFEMHVNGRQENFLRLDFPSGKPVSAKNMLAFKQVRDQYMARLNREQKLARASE